MNISVQHRGLIRSSQASIAVVCEELFLECSVKITLMNEKMFL